MLPSGPGDPLTVLYSTGPVGVVLVVLFWAVIKGHLVAGREHDRVVQENDELRRQVPDVVLALQASTGAIQASTEAVKEATQVQRDTLVVLEVRKRS